MQVQRATSINPFKDGLRSNEEEQKHVLYDHEASDKSDKKKRRNSHDEVPIAIELIDQEQNITKIEEELMTEIDEMLDGEQQFNLNVQKMEQSQLSFGETTGFARQRRSTRKSKYTHSR